jgi:POT family proton-dependent oligopeptide transporter
VTKLAPPRLVGQMMGVWFLATSLGNLIAGLLAATSAAKTRCHARPLPPIVLTASITGVVLLIFAKPIQRWRAGLSDANELAQVMLRSHVRRGCWSFAECGTDEAGSC